MYSLYHTHARTSTEREKKSSIYRLLSSKEFVCKRKQFMLLYENYSTIMIKVINYGSCRKIHVQCIEMKVTLFFKLIIVAQI